MPGLQFILSCSILVVLHELGHFLAARWFKCRVEKFYLFFNPGFSLFKKKIGETEYGLGWIPFGGFVKFSGMKDESMDEGQMQAPPKPWEFRSKPAWQRLIINLGGVTVNVLVAFTIFIMVTWVWGDRYIPVSNLKYGLYADSLGRKIGMEDGDNIIAIGGKPVKQTNLIGSEIILNEATSLTVLRNGRRIELALPADFISTLCEKGLNAFCTPQYPEIIDSVPPIVKVLEGHVQKGDTLIAIEGHPIKYATDIDRDTSLNYIRNANQVRATFRRGNDTVQMLVARQPEIGTGIRYKNPDDILGYVQVNYTLLQAVPAGIHKSIKTPTAYFRNLKLLLIPKEVKVRDNLSGLMDMVSVFLLEWDWKSFWLKTAIFSILIGFSNLLPILPLDGGHVLIILVEIISGRKPRDKFIRYAQLVGTMLLFSLMAFAVGLDIFRMFS